MAADNLLGKWMMSHILRRMGKFGEGTNIMGALFNELVPDFENKVAIGRISTQQDASNSVAFRLRFDYAQCHLIELKYVEAIHILEPLVADTSNYTAKAMSLMLCAGALSFHGRHDDSIAMFHKIITMSDSGKDTSVGPMDEVLIEKLGECPQIKSSFSIEHT